jgi:hypothetical protein
MIPLRPLILCVALSACAASPQWDKPGATPAMAQQDSEQCRAKARVEAPVPAAFAQTGRTTERVLTFEEERTQNELVYFQKCMQERGYSAKRG